METTTVRREYTAAEIQEINKAAEQLHGFDESPEGSQHNADIIDAYFQQNRIPITVANIFKCVEARKQDFKWLSPAQVEYNKVAAENVNAAQQLVAWLDTQGKPGQLVNLGDQAYENLTLLLIELRGRPVDSQRIHEGIGRISFRPGRQLHYLPEPRKQDSRSHAATDDGEPFLGKVNVNEPRWRRMQREREEREARDAASQPSAASVATVAAREAKQKAESLRGGTHSESEQLQKTFVTTPGTSEIDWPNTLAARLTLQRSLNKAQEVRRFIR
jgi:hypothetical protein